jgi:hypothetical protein
MGAVSGYHETYTIQFLSRNPIVVNEAVLTASLERRLGRLSLEERTGRGEPWRYRLGNYPMTGQANEPPSLLAFLQPETVRPQDTTDQDLGRIVEQSWRTPNARELYAAMKHRLVMAHIAPAPPMPDKLRRDAIINGVLALLEAAEFDLVSWTATEQMLTPAFIKQAYSDPEEMAEPQVGFINSRRFRIGDEILMDTVGLSALGLSDFEIHFRGLDPRSVTDLVAWLVGAVFANGDVIEDGDRFGKYNWPCRREAAFMGPERRVVAIDPGPEFGVYRKSQAMRGGART